MFNKDTLVVNGVCRVLENELFALTDGVDGLSPEGAVMVAVGLACSRFRPLTVDVHSVSKTECVLCFYSQDKDDNTTFGVRIVAEENEDGYWTIRTVAIPNVAIPTVY